MGLILAEQFGWKVAEVGGTDVHLHGLFFVLLCGALIFAGSSGRRD